MIIESIQRVLKIIRQLLVGHNLPRKPDILNVFNCVCVCVRACVRACVCVCMSPVKILTQHVNLTSISFHKEFV